MLIRAKPFRRGIYAGAYDLGTAQTLGLDDPLDISFGDGDLTAVGAVD